MAHRQGDSISLGAFLLLLMMLMGSIQCQSSVIVQFWYADINDVIDPSKADAKWPNAVVGVVSLTPKEDVADGTIYINTLRGSGSPPGTNVEAIAWNPDLADKAKTSALTCDSSPSNRNEIVAASQTPITISDALNKIRTNCQDRTQMCSKSCLQFSMLMTAGVNKFGCAKVQCPDTVLPHRVHCILEPDTAVDGGKKCANPYDTDGKPCEKCPRSKGYCYKNLCVSHADMQEIKKETPGAVATCSAPCRNCGVRRDVNNECFCECEPGTHGNACEQGKLSSVVTCGNCAKAGTPCLNGGIDAGEINDCKCLCPFDFVGQRCEFPRDQVVGGTQLIISGRPSPPCQGTDCKNMVPGIDEVEGPILKEIKQKLADEVNRFCVRDKASFEKCCGSSAPWPVTDPRDFVTPDNIKIPGSLIGYTSDGKLATPIQVLAPGNNGLCKKKVADSTMLLPVPNDVLRQVIQSKLSPCCNGVTLEYKAPQSTGFNKPSVISTMSVNIL